MFPLVVWMLSLPQQCTPLLGSPPQGSPALQDLFRCQQACDCPPVRPPCQDGVPLVVDGCGCCLVCARQQGDACNAVQICDSARKLQCSYGNPSSTSGICRVRRGQECHVGASKYLDGETFKTDCRTQCTCQNGTYGCVSLCPQESVKPSDRCQHPRLVQMHGSCCREWLCDSTVMEDRRVHCQPHTGEWSPCSRTCGVGISTRISNGNPECRLKNESRLCTLRPCPEAQHQAAVHAQGHHMAISLCACSRRGVECIDFQVVGRQQGYEERQYPATTWVSTTLESPSLADANREMYKKLFSYIQGHNVKGMKINTTTPIRTRIVPCHGATCATMFIMSFLVPAELSDNTPYPLDTELFVEKDPPAIYAVRSFEGRPTESDWLEESHRLAALLRKDPGIDRSYYYTAWYDPPYQLFHRTNEVWMTRKPNNNKDAVKPLPTINAEDKAE